mgnify:FL=1
MVNYKIDFKALQEMLEDFGIEAEIKLTADGYCEVITEEITYLITEEE